MASENSLDKAGIIEKHRIHPTDCGSPEVQIAILTSRIELLSKHFEKHGEDKHSKRGMMGLIGRRKKLLQYLKGENVERYRATLSALGLRK